MCTFHCIDAVTSGETDHDASPTGLLDIRGDASSKPLYIRRDASVLDKNSQFPKLRSLARHPGFLIPGPPHRTFSKTTVARPTPRIPDLWPATPYFFQNYGRSPNTQVPRSLVYHTVLFPHLWPTSQFNCVCNFSSPTQPSEPVHLRSNTRHPLHMPQQSHAPHLWTTSQAHTFCLNSTVLATCQVPHSPVSLSTSGQTQGTHFTCTHFSSPHNPVKLSA